MVEHFGIEVGSILIVGPSSLAVTLTCVSGYTCPIGDLDVNNFIAVRDTCGLVSPVNGVPLNSQQTNLSSALSSDWYVRTSAAGGLYRLCWCASFGRCEDSFTDFGSLQVLGPSPLNQDQTCAFSSSSGCALQIAFRHGDWSPGRLAILETCETGFSSTVDEHSTVHFLGTSETARVVTTSATHSVQINEEFHSNLCNGPISACGGQYSLCWCALTPGPCLQASDFHVHVGRLTVIGPSNMHHKTCIVGQQCSLQGLLGTGLGDFGVFIADTCGIDNGVVSAVVNGGVGPMRETATWGGRGMQGLGSGLYRLCWCEEANTCFRAVDYLDIGSILLIGPSLLREGRTCISGLTCKFDGLTGYLSGEDKVILSDTCGTASASATFEVAQIFVSPDGFGASVAWGSPLKASGGLYRLCWCSGHSNCFVGENFNFDVGTLSMIGVALQQDRTCLSGLPCAVEGISGKFLSSEDKFLILETCGVSAVDGLPWGAESYATSSGASLSFTLPMTATTAGHYQLCWCSGMTRDLQNVVCGNLDGENGS